MQLSSSFVKVGVVQNMTGPCIDGAQPALSDSKKLSRAPVKSVKRTQEKQLIQDESIMGVCRKCSILRRFLCADTTRPMMLALHQNAL